MRKRWLGLAATVGLLSAAVVWLWPTMPLWHKSVPADAEVLRFGPDDRALYTVDGLTWNFRDPLTVRHCRLCRWDAATGALMDTVSVPFGATPKIEAGLSPDARTLLLAEIEARPAMSARNPPSRIYPPSSKWLLFDAQSGRRHGVAVDDVAHFNPRAFSPDGRWFWVYHSTRVKPSDGIDVVDTATGKRVVELRDRNIETVVDCCFSPDGNLAAVHWRKGSESATRDSVRIIQLPGGLELRRFDLPQRFWQRVGKWVGDRLFAEVDVPTGSGHLRQSYSFDLTAESIGEGRLEPLLSGGFNGGDEIYWEDGPGWVAHLSLGPREPKRWEEWLEWIAPRFRISFQAERGNCNRVRFLDADTGRLRYELPNPVRYPCTISSDGKRVACVEPGGVVAVWDADPPPRWPWVLVVGLIGAGSILIFGGWRSRRLLAVAKAS